jgi:hypothetical protein
VAQALGSAFVHPESLSPVILATARHGGYSVLDLLHVAPKPFVTVQLLIQTVNVARRCLEPDGAVLGLGQSRGCGDEQGGEQGVESFIVVIPSSRDAR